jgi:hypothetical protein
MVLGEVVQSDNYLINQTFAPHCVTSATASDLCWERKVLLSVYLNVSCPLVSTASCKYILTGRRHVAAMWSMSRQETGGMSILAAWCNLTTSTILSFMHSVPVSLVFFFRLAHLFVHNH